MDHLAGLPQIPLSSADIGSQAIVNSLNPNNLKNFKLSVKNIVNFQI